MVFNIPCGSTLKVTNTRVYDTERHRESRACTSRRQGGFSLLEVLVALGILGIGVLGMANLQTLALRMDRDNLLHMRAMQLAQNALEFTRANPRGRTTILYGQTPTTPPDCSSVGASCTPEEMARFDLALWKCDLGGWDSLDLCGLEAMRAAGSIDCNTTSLGSGCASLPGGDGQITMASGIMTVSIRWGRQDAEDSPELSLQARMTFP